MGVKPKKQKRKKSNSAEVPPKPEPKKARPAHRPEIILDPQAAEAFGRMKATHETMAEFFAVSHDTIARRMADPESEFCVAYKKGFSSLRMRLSEKQVSLAMAGAGNVTMLIWLGKQYLGQSDKQEIAGDIHSTTTADPDEYKNACREVMKEFERVSNPA